MNLQNGIGILETLEMIFKTKAVGSKVNCDACHTDAASGRFDDAAIALPKETKK